jgi:hypothetical protein
MRLFVKGDILAKVPSLINNNLLPFPFLFDFLFITFLEETMYDLVYLNMSKPGSQHYII